MVNQNVQHDQPNGTAPAGGGGAIGVEAQPGRKRVLILEDDAVLADVVRRYLERDGFEVEHVSDGVEGLARATAAPPDLLILDLMLPGLDGVEVFHRLQAVAPVPTIMVTARDHEDDRVYGLMIGADDYVAKPFSPRELTLRVKAVLRRSTLGEVTPGGARTADAGAMVVGPLEVDTRTRRVTIDGRPVSLTVREFDLLSFLMSNRDRVFRREELLERVWGYTVGDTSTVTVHVRRIREKIERDPSDPQLIQTVWGFGYRFGG